ncbi:MAG TPA: hypothetical protein VGO55_01160 [Allosphingosinicella sp.]|jgi:hypothetical protein|nr:hypothetical protein [Allosphingosinicella sp.]
MRKSLNLLAAASLLAALGACSRQPDRVTPDDERLLNEARGMTEDNTIYDTSPDDQTANAETVEIDENAAVTPSGSGAGNGTANRQ